MRMVSGKDIKGPPKGSQREPESEPGSGTESNAEVIPKVYPNGDPNEGWVYQKVAPKGCPEVSGKVHGKSERHPQIDVYNQVSIWFGAWESNGIH